MRAKYCCVLEKFNFITNSCFTKNIHLYKIKIQLFQNRAFLKNAHFPFDEIKFEFTITHPCLPKNHIKAKLWKKKVITSVLDTGSSTKALTVE